MITGKMENAICAASISEVISTYTRISAHPHLQVPLHLTLSHHLFFLNPKKTSAMQLNSSTALFHFSLIFLSIPQFNLWVLPLVT